MADKTVFEKIIDKEIPADFVYEDDVCVGIKDINPKAPIHFLLVPRKAIPKFSDLEVEDEGILLHLFQVAKELAKKNNCKDFRLQINNGEKAGQTVFHLHLHLMGWPA